MAARIPDDERFADLLVTRVIDGLSATEQEELNEFTARHPDADLDSLERVAASLALSGLRIEPMPASLRARIQADAEALFSGRAQPQPAAVVTQFPARPRPTTAWGGWFAAAAAFVMAVVGWLQVDRLDQDRSALAARQAALQGSVARLERSLAEKDEALSAMQDPSPAELMAVLQARADTVVVPWSATADPAAGGAEGAVLWNPAEQAGLMRFRGLEANDPTVAQYQLWIFDAGRDDRFPVDGGVFDVPPGVDEVLVPIRARLPVGQAVLFAITVEAPGGVVVSSRERIALVAQPGA